MGQPTDWCAIIVRKWPGAHRTVPNTPWGGMPPARESAHGESGAAARSRLTNSQISGGPWSTFGASAVTPAPVHTTLPVLMAEACLWALLI